VDELETGLKIVVGWRPSFKSKWHQRLCASPTRHQSSSSLQSQRRMILHLADAINKGFHSVEGTRNWLSCQWQVQLR